MYAIYAAMSMTLILAILKVTLNRELNLKIYPIHGYVRSAVFQKKDLKRFKREVLDGRERCVRNVQRLSP